VTKLAFVLYYCKIVNISIITGQLSDIIIGLPGIPVIMSDRAYRVRLHPRHDESNA